LVGQVRGERRRMEQESEVERRLVCDRGRNQESRGMNQDVDLTLSHESSNEESNERRWKEGIDEYYLKGLLPLDQERKRQLRPQWGEISRALRELIQDLRTLLAPNHQIREWRQIGMCQRIISDLELVLNQARIAQKWLGDPGVHPNRLTIQLRKLQEGWMDPYVNRIQIIRGKAVKYWGSVWKSG
jgi:hypothetical protein